MLELVFVLMIAGETRYTAVFTDHQTCYNRVVELKKNSTEAICVAKTIEEILISGRTDVRNYM